MANVKECVSVYVEESLFGKSSGVEGDCGPGWPCGCSGANAGRRGAAPRRIPRANFQSVLLATITEGGTVDRTSLYVFPEPPRQRVCK